MTEKPQRKSTLPEWAKPRGQGPASAAPAVPPPMRADENFRVSREAAKGIAIGAAVLLLVAGGIGFFAGQKIAGRRYATQLEAEKNKLYRPLMPSSTTIPEVSAPVAAHSGASAPPTAVPAAVETDPRMAGLNYFCLCRVPGDTGEKVAKFLAGKGHRTWRVPAPKHEGMVLVFAVDKGFSGKDREGRECTQFRAKLLALGDEWKKSGGKYNPFTSMMLQKYNR